MELDWNDPRLVLAVSRAGNLAGAATTLGVDHSTVFRRLSALEQKTGTRLFERIPGAGYQPTAAGERMIAAAARMEDETLALERAIAGHDLSPTGRLRVTSSETLAYRLLTPHLADFRKAYPGIVVELALDNRVFSLSRREADIALRPIRPKENDLWGRKLADIAWSLYGARAYLKQVGVPAPNGDDLGRYSLIGWDETARRFGGADWFESQAPAEAFVYRTASLVNQLVAAKASIGLAVLPCYLGDPEPDLTRAFAEPIAELTDELWIVTHIDLKNTARVRAFFDVVGTGLAGARDLAEGRKPAR